MNANMTLGEHVSIAWSKCLVLLELIALADWGYSCLDTRRLH